MFQDESEVARRSRDPCLRRVTARAAFSITPGGCGLSAPRTASLIRVGLLSLAMLSLLTVCAQVWDRAAFLILSYYFTSGPSAP